MANNSNEEFLIAKMIGRVSVDLKQVTERTAKLRSYSFAEVCQENFDTPKETLDSRLLTRVCSSSFLENFYLILVCNDLILCDLILGSSSLVTMTTTRDWFTMFSATSPSLKGQSPFSCLLALLV